jgi:hypothetical protein
VVGAKPLPIYFRCPHCQQGLIAAQSDAGKKARCPLCCRRLEVPMPEPAEAGDIRPGEATERPRQDFGGFAADAGPEQVR